MRFRVFASLAICVLLEKYQERLLTSLAIGKLLFGVTSCRDTHCRFSYNGHSRLRGELHEDCRSPSADRCRAIDSLHHVATEFFRPLPSRVGLRLINRSR